MTRIISGRAGGTVIDVPPKGTRPTSDRVRESLFGALDSADLVDGARVLDLYAGSGALGLESLSRGAASADLVELAAPAAALIRKNAERLRAAGVAGTARVHRANATTFAETSTSEWDLVFLDPPYNKGLGERSVASGLEGNWLAPGALIVWEESAAPSPPEGLEQLDQRRYGDTIVTILRKTG